MSGDTDLSAGLQDIVSLLSEPRFEDGVTIGARELRKFVKLLSVLQSMAVNLEIEVRCLRDMEASGEAHGAMEDEATHHLSELLAEIDGNVIRPNFGGRS